MARKGRKRLQYALQAFFSKNQVTIMQNTEQEEVLKALGADLSENEVNAMDIYGKTEL